MAQTERLTEYANNRGIGLAGKIDRDKGELADVKILGLESANGRRYSEQAIKNAIQLYEGAKVNINHPAKPGDPVRYEARFGSVHGIYEGARGLYAKAFRFNPKHQLSEQFAWDAEHAPENLGFSHNIEGRTTRANGVTLVEEITKVHSVDLVADPATTKSLFEAEGDMEADAAPAAPGGTDPVAAILDTIGDKIVEIAKSDADLTTKKAQIVDLLKKQDKIKAMLSDEKPPAKSDAPADDAPKTEALLAQVSTLREQVATLTAKNAAAERASLVETKLAKVPTHLQSPELRQLLTEAKDEAAIDRLIGTITAAAKNGNRPRSVGPNPINESLLEGVKDTKSFVHALTH